MKMEFVGAFSCEQGLSSCPYATKANGTYLLLAPAPRARKPPHGHRWRLQLLLRHSTRRRRRRRRRRLVFRRCILHGPLPRREANAEPGGERVLGAIPRRRHCSRSLKGDSFSHTQSSLLLLLLDGEIKLDQDGRIWG